MGDIAVRVSGLGKQYRIGARRRRSDSLRETLLESVGGVARLLRGQRAQAESETIWALKDVSFEVKRGEVLGIIGRNGAGKSTLLKILARITEPTCGEVDVYGRVGSLLEVGTGFHPELTGRENVYLNGAVLGMRRREIQGKFDEIVDFAGIDKFIDTPVKHYSSGMYMRLAFAVAAHLEPEILIVDEVLAVGDAEFQKKCLGKMGEVARGGRTVLFVSHNMAALQRLCTVCILLDHGALVLHDALAGVIRAYLENGPTAGVEWTRDTSPKSVAYFQRVFLCDRGGRPLSSVATGASVSVGLEFVSQAAFRDLQISLDVLDGATGEAIFTSAPQDIGLKAPDQPGSFRALVDLPAGIFMPRGYILRTVLWSPSLGALDRREVLSFIPVETDSLANNTPGGRLGQIVLRCNWSIERCTAPVTPEL